MAVRRDDQGCPPEQIDAVKIEKLPTVIKGVSQGPPNDCITSDEIDVAEHARGDEHDVPR